MNPLAKPSTAADGAGLGGEPVERSAARDLAAAAAVEQLGGAVAAAVGGAQDVFHGDGWRLLLKLLLCAAPPDGDSPFHSRPAKDLCVPRACLGAPL